MANPTHILAIVLFSSLFLTACTASVTEQAISADNKRIYGINCSGKAIPMSSCYDKATQLCPRGYTILRMDAKSPYNDPFPTILNISSNIAMAIPGVKKGITIKCK